MAADLKSSCSSCLWGCHSKCTPSGRAT